MRTCEVDGCTRKHVAKGMCVNHYNRENYTREQRHPKVEYACDSCGATMLREQRRRYAHKFCTDLCRNYFLYGAQTCTYPAKKPRAASTPKPKPILRQIECGWCGTRFASTRSTARFCQSRCKDKFKKAARRGREANATGTYSWAEIARLWVRFDRACAYCQSPTPLADIQAEHVVPLSKRGANNLTNLLPSCALCNGDKRDLLLQDWATDRASRHKPPVRTTWADADPLFKHLTSIQSGPLIAA